MSSGYGSQHASQYGYQNLNTPAASVSFRCNVDYRGAVTNVRIGSNMAYGRLTNWVGAVAQICDRPARREANQKKFNRWPLAKTLLNTMSMVAHRSA